MTFAPSSFSESLRSSLTGLCLLLLATVGMAAVPSAPSGLTISMTKGAASHTYAALWTDNSNNETGFQVDVRVGTSGGFTVISSAASNAPGVLFGLTSPLANGTTLQYQVRAVNAEGTSTPSNLVTFVIPADAFAAPTIGTTTATSETVVRTSWTDNSTTEDGEELEVSSDGGTTYTKQDDILFYQLKSYNIPAQPGTTYKVRLRAYKEGTPRTYTAYSSVATATTPFNAPTGLSATANGENAVNLTWVDNSLAEGGYALYYKQSTDSAYTLFNYTARNATSASITGLQPGTAYNFQVAAAFQANQSSPIIESARSNTANATTKDGFLSGTAPPIFYNQSFSYQAVVSTGSTRNSWNITGLPAGLTFNSSTGAVTGTPTVTGAFSCPMSATFANSWTTSNTLQLRVIRAPAAPVVATTIGTQTITTGGNTSVSLTDKFSDPDSESAVRIVTNLGTMDFILYNSATPATVTNFLSYVNASVNNYNGAVFHRSVPGFIVQGGAFKVQSAPNNFTATPTSPSPTNEPGISNLRGTVAMAKVGGNPDSATDQFFVNLANNSSNLDRDSGSVNANGGFTAFARVAGNGMTTADAIAGLPRVQTGANIDGVANSSLTDWPLTSSSASMDTTKVVSITSAAPVPVLSYALTGNTNPTAVTASISGGTNVQVGGSAGGQSNITVTATDLDGNTVAQTFTVTVNQTPLFTSAAPTNSALLGSSYSFTCTASGYPAPTFSVPANTLPTGLTLNPTSGVISGTPSVTGVFSGTITAGNGIGSNATQNFSITINQAPTFTSAAPTSSALFGSSYNFTCTASGYPAPSFSVPANTLPTGLTLSPTSGVISGTTSATGVFSGIITASNGIGSNATQNFSITINKAPTFTSAAPTSTGLLGSSYSFTCTASGYPAPTFSVPANTLPTGLTLNPTSGVISGTPSATGVFSGTITASNGIGSNATQNFSITINATVSGWAASKGLMGSDALWSADPDHDGRNNLNEFAFMTEPNQPTPSTVPSFTLAEPGATKFGEITFPVRKFAPSLTYTVEVSDTLDSGSWTTLWTTANGFGAATVTAAVDQTDRTILTVRDTQPSPPAERRFLRVSVSAP